MEGPGEARAGLGKKWMIPVPFTQTLNSEQVHQRMPGIESDGNGSGFVRPIARPVVKDAITYI